LFLVVLLVLPHRDGVGRLGRGHVIDRGKTVGFLVSKCVVRCLRLWL
jgi:hypothetical protein